MVRGIPPAVATGFMVIFLMVLFAYATIFLDEQGIVVDEFTSSSLPAHEIGAWLVIGGILLGMIIMLLGGLKRNRL